MNLLVTFLSFGGSNAAFALTLSMFGWSLSFRWALIQNVLNASQNFCQKLLCLLSTPNSTSMLVFLTLVPLNVGMLLVHCIDQTELLWIEKINCRDRMRFSHNLLSLIVTVNNPEPSLTLRSCRLQLMHLKCHWFEVTGTNLWFWLV